MTRTRLIVPVLSGVLAILFAIAVLVGWNIIFTRYYLLASESRVSDLGLGYWLILSFGDAFLVGVVAVLALFLVSNVRQALHARRQSAFLDSVTHELKTPLASLRLCLDTIEARPVTPDTARTLVGMMRGDVERLHAFIEHLLEAGRLEHGERDLLAEPTELPALVRRCAEQIARRHDLPAGAIAVQVRLSEPARPALADPVAVETIVLNLIDNAVKYSPAGGPVAVELGDAEDGVHVAVRDRGQGLARRELRRVFQRFYRVRRAGARQVHGTGLGLYVVAALARRMGGRVWAESEGPGRGCTFHVDLPWAAPEAR